MQWHRAQRFGDTVRTARPHSLFMLTVRAAAALLAHADSLRALRPLTQALGFATTHTTLSANARHTLGVHDLTTHADVIRGPGTLRLCAAELAPPLELGTLSDPRERTRQLALALLHHAPTRHWCLLTLDHTATHLCLATVSAYPTGPRIAALRVDRRHIVDSDADTIRNLAAITEDDGALRHARFSDVLRRDALSHRFYRALEQAVTTLAHSATGNAPPAVRRELALLCASRCLFLAFLEAKGWLDARRDFLLHHTTTQLERGGRLHERLLRPLFFGTLNTPHAQRAPAAHRFGAIPFLNGGLFAPTRLEKRHRTLRFSDDALTALIGNVLDRFRFTAHEDSSAWSEAAVDPEMLGRAFESLMAADERRRSGTFYTPPTIVEQVVHDALHTALPDLPAHALTNDPSPLTLSPTALATLHAVRVLDPACGSGAFLVRLLECLATLHQRAGDPRLLHDIRRDILTRSIFGVDRNPVAVWLCELRLWLSVVIECHETDVTHVPPLPNLDHHIRVGDSLAGGTFHFAPPSARTLTALRARYTRASGPRKVTLAAALEREERARAVAALNRQLLAATSTRRTHLAIARARDLFGQRPPTTRTQRLQLLTLRSTVRTLTSARDRVQLGAALPFRFVTYFADVAASGGFSIVIGNPPWVRPHAMPATARHQLRLEFRSMRHAAWRAGALRAGAGTGFAAQADLAAAFIERSVDLLAPHGTLALLVPAKLWRTLAGGGIRELLTQHTDIRTLRDWSDAPALFDAATYPSLVVATRHPKSSDNHQQPAPPMPPTRLTHVAIARHRSTVRFELPTRSLSLDGDPTAPWILLPPAVRTAFDALRTAGPALGDAGIGRPLLGVKCGCNAAFLVTANERDDDTADISALGATPPRLGVIERHLLRPALRGEAIRISPAADGTAQPVKRDAADDDLRIVWTHGPDGLPLRTLPPATARWMAHWRPRLELRGDARRQQPWWTLFRTEAARYDAPRLVWADIGKRLRTRILPAGDPTVPLNSCYVLRTATIEDARALEVIMRSALAAAWLDVLAEPARGGFRRYLGWTVATLPLPPDWHAARRLLTPLADAHARGTEIPDAAQHDIIAQAYGLRADALTPLLDWSSACD